MKLQCLKLFIMTKTKQKKNEFLKDFREISVVGSLKAVADKVMFVLELHRYFCSLEQVYIEKYKQNERKYVVKM